MRKWIIGGCLLSLFFVSPAYAHISGAFGDFLSGIEDESTTEKLKKEIAETKEEIERLAPRVDALEAEYYKKEEMAVTKLKYYNTVGLDTFMTFIMESEGIVHMLASQRIVEKNLEQYLQELNMLYLDYMQVKLTKESLEGHEKLLGIIQSNLAAREALLSQYQNLTSVQLAMLVGSTWEKYVGTPLEERLVSDSMLLNENIKELVTQKTKDSPFRIEESLLNEKAKLTYHIRSDHIYVHFKNEGADVILIGIITKENENKASLLFEAGFINGVMLSTTILNELKGFEIHYSSLNPASKDFYVEQTNGAIVIHPIEKAME